MREPPTTLPPPSLPTQKRRPRFPREWTGGLLTLGVLATAAWVAAPEQSAADTAGSASLPMGSLIGRDLVLRITHTADGPRYTVTSGDGTVLFERLDEESLRLHFPDLDPAGLHAGVGDPAQNGAMGSDGY